MYGDNRCPKKVVARKRFRPSAPIVEDGARAIFGIACDHTPCYASPQNHHISSSFLLVILTVTLKADWAVFDEVEMVEGWFITVQTFRDCDMC